MPGHNSTKASAWIKILLRFLPLRASATTAYTILQTGNLKGKI